MWILLLCLSTYQFAAAEDNDIFESVAYYKLDLCNGKELPQRVLETYCLGSGTAALTNETAEWFVDACERYERQHLTRATFGQFHPAFLNVAQAIQSLAIKHKWIVGILGSKLTNGVIDYYQSCSPNKDCYMIKGNTLRLSDSSFTWSGINMQKLINMTEVERRKSRDAMVSAKRLFELMQDFSPYLPYMDFPTTGGDEILNTILDSSLELVDKWIGDCLSNFRSAVNYHNRDKKCKSPIPF